MKWCMKKGDTEDNFKVGDYFLVQRMGEIRRITHDGASNLYMAIDSEGHVKIRAKTIQGLLDKTSSIIKVFPDSIIGNNLVFCTHQVDF